MGEVEGYWCAADGLHESAGCRPDGAGESLAPSRLGVGRELEVDEGSDGAAGGPLPRRRRSSFERG